MKITENKKGRCTGCCAAALFAGLDRTYDFLLVAPVFLHPAEKDAKNHLTNCYGGGVLYRKSRLHKKVMGACKKIVRLIIMSNISRRQFLKGAGVATLAVAAAGVLAGCSKEDIEKVVTKDVKVVFMCNGATVGDKNYLKVAQDKTTVAVSEIPSNYFPVGYKVVSTGELKIAKLPTGEDGIKVMLDEIEVPVDIYYYEVVDGKEVDRMIFEGVTVCASQKTITKKVAEQYAGDSYTVVGDGPFTINWSNNTVRVEAKKK